MINLTLNSSEKRSTSDFPAYLYWCSGGRLHLHMNTTQNDYAVLMHGEGGYTCSWHDLRRLQISRCVGDGCYTCSDTTQDDSTTTTLLLLREVASPIHDDPRRLTLTCCMGDGLHLHMTRPKTTYILLVYVWVRSLHLYMARPKTTHTLLVYGWGRYTCTWHPWATTKRQA